MKLVVLTGIPGSGSTTVLKKTLEEVDYLHLNYGDIMTEIAVEKGLVENRDELRKLPAETQKEIQAQAAKEIKERSENDNVIVGFSVQFRDEFEEEISLIKEGDEITFRGKLYEEGFGWTDCELVR